MWGLLALLLAAPACAAPAVDKTDPPDWWVRHSRNPLQVMLTGRDLKGAAANADSQAIGVRVLRTSDDGRYLFLSLDIRASARPGSHRFRVTGPAGSTEFTFTLHPQLPKIGGPVTPDDVIYLLMPDRFVNGDPSNDSPPEYGHPADRSTNNAYHGGDFEGIRRRLGYLKDLGVTGIWMLPVYKNSSRHSSPAHGYHAVDFYAAESRFGSMDDLRRLVEDAHGAGIKVIQDQVANHCGPFHPWLEAPPTPTWFHHPDKMPRLRNNFDIPALADPYARPKRRMLPLEGWFASHLPDFNQDDPLLRDYVIQNALWWIGKTGVDGIRQDTYPYADRPFWEQWQAAIDRQFPGFWVVGEITAPTPAVLSFFEGGVRRYGVDTGLPAMLDFPLHRAVRAVFAQGQPMTLLAEVLAQDSLYRRPGMLVPFLGNHDVARFLSVAGGDIRRLLMAQAFLLTTRGIPHLYYGDEIAMGKGDAGGKGSVRADFPGGFPGDPVSAFTPEGRRGDAATVFNALRALLHFRRGHPALRRGELVNLVTEKDRYVYLRRSPEENVLVVFSRAGQGQPLELDVDDLGLPEGLRFRAWDGATPEAVVAQGKLRIAALREVDIFWAPRLSSQVTR